MDDVELTRILIAHAVTGVIKNNPNSYITAYTENWLAHARRLGAYQGAIIGNCKEVLDAWLEIYEKFRSEFPDSPEYLERIKR